MQKIQIDVPGHFYFTTQVAIRITDINYGNHVGNDAFMALLHEARLQFLQYKGYTELQVAGHGLIMADAAIKFMAELFYGDLVDIAVAASGFGTSGFDIVYRMHTNRMGEKKLAALAKTGMILFDYSRRKPVAIPESVRQHLLAP
jgi:acyl-CoA thioesterase FadM